MYPFNNDWRSFFLEYSKQNNIHTTTYTQKDDASKCHQRKAVFKQHLADVFLHFDAGSISPKSATLTQNTRFSLSRHVSRTNVLAGKCINRCLVLCILNMHEWLMCATSLARCFSDCVLLAFFRLLLLLLLLCYCCWCCFVKGVPK